MIKHRRVQAAFKGDAGIFVLNPGDSTQRGLETGDSQVHRFTFGDEAVASLDLAAVFGKIEQIDIDLPRTDPPNDKDAPWPALGDPRYLTLVHGYLLPAIGQGTMAYPPNADRKSAM